MLMAAEKKYVEIGARLRALRMALHSDMSITDYTKMMEVNYTRYLNWESGLNRPQPNEAVVFCEKLGATLDFIYRGIETALAQSTAKALAERPELKAHNKSKDSPDSSAV